MNDLSTALTQLGETLTGEFQLRLAVWGLPDASDFELPASDLSALFQLGRDISHWQAAGAGWETLESGFTGGFIPDNLTGADPFAEPEETGAETPAPAPRSSVRIDQYPFSSPPEKVLFSQNTPKSLPFSAQNPKSMAGAAASIQANQQPISPDPALETDLISGAAFHSSGMPLPPFFKKPAEENSAGLPGSPERSGAPALSPAEPGAAPQQTSSAPETNAENNRPEAHSIWTQPLQGLGDFLSRCEQTPEPVAPMPPPVPNQAATPAGGASRPLPPDGETGASPFPEPNPDFSPPAPFSPPGMPAAPMTSGLEKPVENSENLPFRSVGTKRDDHTTAPDTDDILDELTQRIIRDFRRFYP